MAASQGNDNAVDILGGNGVPMIRKSKLLIVDLAGSERINKSGLFFFFFMATTNHPFSPFLLMLYLCFFLFFFLVKLSHEQLA